MCDCQKNNRIPPIPSNCTNPTIGGQLVEEESGQKGIGRFCSTQSKIACANLHAAQNIKGYWYLTLAIWRNKTWRTIQVSKQITKECHKIHSYPLLKIIIIVTIAVKDVMTIIIIASIIIKETY